MQVHGVLMLTEDEYNTIRRVMGKTSTSTFADIEGVSDSQADVMEAVWLSLNQLRNTHNDTI